MKIKNSIFLCFLIFSLVSCGSARKTVGSPEGNKSRTSTKLAEKITENAREYLGTSYKYGGTTKKGMDCSGLIHTAFSKEDIEMPRISRDMALKGTRLYLKEVQTGDLLFFETNKNKKVINHVGLVVKRDPEEIFFIHSSTSQGVIISSLNSNYWREHFVMARRVL